MDLMPFTISSEKDNTEDIYLSSSTGPRFRPFVGNLPELAENEYPEALYQWFLKHGPVYRFFMGPTPIVVFCDPEIMKTVGVKLFQDFHDRTPMQSTETAAVGLVFSK
jgi:hypothetical protein